MKRELSSLQSWREMLVEHSLDAVIGIDSESNVIDWNFQAEKTFGWSKEDALGKKISSLIMPEEFRAAHHAGIKLYLQTGIGPILNKRIELVAVNSSGHSFPIELTVSPINVENQILFYSFVRDISERKAMENALKEAIAQREEFIRVCSHELKTPISSMKLQFQMAKHMIDKNNPKAFAKESIEKRIINTNLQLDKMSKLIEDMLYATKISSGALKIEKTPIDLNEIISETLITFEDQLEISHLQVSFIKSTVPVIVHGDRYRLEQVITNLITNAIKYGNENPFEIKIEIHQNEGRIIVSDQGIGIPRDNLDKIFNRYERVDSDTNVHGLGLGLYICDQIMHAHEGKILVESELGQGSKFILVFPLLN